MRSERVNPNIELACDNCKKIFLRTKYEISRRKYKKNRDGSPRDHNFCSRSCAVSWRNKNRKPEDVPSGSFKFRPQVGNNHGQKYCKKFAWYIKRMKHDTRFNECWKLDIEQMEQALEKLWTGKCHITGVNIALRDPRGRVDEENPFFIASIDRVDNSKPYSPTNVQWVSTAINMARNKHSNEKFREYLRQFLTTVK